MSIWLADKHTWVSVQSALIKSACEQRQKTGDLWPCHQHHVSVARLTLNRPFGKLRCSALPVTT